MKLKLLGIGAVLLGIAAFGLAAQADRGDGGRWDEFAKNIRQRKHSGVCADGADTMHCFARVAVNDAGTPDATSAPTSGYGPAQFRGAYGLTGKAIGSPVIAIVDAYDDPYILSDLTTYSNAFGIPVLPNCSGAIASSPVPCFKKADQNGGSRYPSSNSGWALEISLDVEVAHAVCDNCKILLVEARSASYNDLMAAVDRARLLGANYISNSYGSIEFSGETAYDSHFKYPKIVFTFSSGDAGYGSSYPAASPYVTAVGGTTLALNSSNTYGGEAAWSGAGSGCSSYESKPAWQHDPGCATRAIADISADADPSTGAAVYDSVRYAGVRGWFQVGGTSLSSPLIAGVFALSGNTAASGIYVNPALLHDVTTGSNGSCGTYLCNAGIGFDGPTGLGTPNGTAAF